MLHLLGNNTFSPRNCNMSRSTHRQQVLAVLREMGIARARDFGTAGIPRVYLRRMIEEGLLVSRARGLYQLASARPSAAHSLAEAARAVPHGAICLLSALQFYELTTQTPHEVWMLIGWKKWAPKNPPVALRLIRATGQTLASGIKHHKIEKVSVPITVPAKTVADCFKHRNKVGLDIALEALRDCIRKRRATADELWRYAALDRVRNVMRPYLEALL